MSAGQSRCVAFDSLDLSSFREGGQYQTPSLLADSHVANVSSGRLNVVISTPRPGPQLIPFPKNDPRIRPIFSGLVRFFLLVTIVLLIRWSGYEPGSSRALRHSDPSE